MANCNGVSIMPIFELDREEERAIKKTVKRLNRVEAVLSYVGTILWFAFGLWWTACIGGMGLFIGYLIKPNIVILFLFTIGYVVGVVAPCLSLGNDLLEWMDLMFTELWVAFYNRRIDGVKAKYKAKKAESMITEIDKAFE